MDVLGNSRSREVSAMHAPCPLSRTKERHPLEHLYSSVQIEEQFFSLFCSSFRLLSSFREHHR